MPSREELMIGEVREPRLVQRVKKDPHTGQVLREWSEWVLPDGRVQKHGVERQFHLNGAPHWERHFEYGEPVGHWRGWYADGSPLEAAQVNLYDQSSTLLQSQQTAASGAYPLQQPGNAGQLANHAGVL